MTKTIQYEVNICLILNIFLCKLILILSGLPEVSKVAKMANFILSFKIWSVWDLTLPCVIRARKVSISWVATPIRLSRLNLSKRPFRFQSAFFWDIEKDRLTMISTHWATKCKKSSNNQLFLIKLPRRFLLEAFDFDFCHESFIKKVFESILPEIFDIKIEEIFFRGLDDKWFTVWFSASWARRDFNSARFGLNLFITATKNGLDVTL